MIMIYLHGCKILIDSAVVTQFMQNPLFEIMLTIYTCSDGGVDKFQCNIFYHFWGFS